MNDNYEDLVLKIWDVMTTYITKGKKDAALDLLTVFKSSEIELDYDTLENYDAAMDSAVDTIRNSSDEAEEDIF
jgi:ribosome biogenesis protein Tsr3